MFKLISLRASGFKRLDIDEKLHFPDGRLLVHGRNESGKSTLMEAIHYSLYGMPLRPSKNAGNDDIIRYGRNEAIVELEFSIDETQYQVRRELHRKKRNIHLLNKREQGGSLSRVTTGARNVNNELSEILHGIDSDTLLNSCLVEQKELGKLEDANKQERIKAMSSLLNLEAFIGAKDELKKEASVLDKIHSSTQIELQKAEQAKHEYEAAEKRREKAEKRLREIADDKKEAEKKLEKLRKQLEIIQQMKTHQTKINENNAIRRGKQEELKLQKEQLKEIEKAEKELQSIQEKLPETEKKLAELNKQLEIVQHLSDLQENIRDVESKLETIQVRARENQRGYNEATEALEKSQELNKKIEIYKPVKVAAKKIEEIASLFTKLTGSISEEDRLKKEHEFVEERLRDSKDNEEQIKQLESRETLAREKQAQAQKKRTYGTASVFAGLIIVAIMLFYSNLAVAAFGAVILMAGGYLYATNDPNKIEKGITKIRTQREEMLGDRARIHDYYETIERLRTELQESRVAQSTYQEILIHELNQLPGEPREYKAAVCLTEPISINKLRIEVQEDSITLTQLRTEWESQRKKVESLESFKKTLESIQKEKEIKETEFKKLRKQIEETELVTGIKREDEEDKRKQHYDAKDSLTQLTTQRTEHLKRLERRPQVQENINETSNEINLITATIKQEEKKLQELGSHGIKLWDEPNLNQERDANLRKSASLENEEQERANDIEESNKIIEKKEKLKEQHPVLLEESEREEFRLEAMRRATILLDTTRGNIMSGVKQNVEKNMMQFLPTLTDDRYNRIRIDEANYRIEVYDREAKTWRGKGVFSGATQDQFSLALRLAFAISTIPSSRGARPGFIFLDEPLSGFDAQRRSGFMQLLKEDLSRYFDQIIVISHLESLADEFQNCLIIDSGRIIEVQR